MEPTVTFTAADSFTLGDLAPLWNRGYEAYSVPLVLDVAQLGWHITRSDIARSQSVVGLVDGAPFGLSLAAMRGTSAWIGGFGIAMEHRRKGLAMRLMAEQLTRLRKAGMRQVRLEVIDANPAREVYRRNGFAEIRELQAWAGVPRGEAAALEEIATDELARAHPRLHGQAPSWRRQLPTLLHDVEAGSNVLALRRGGAVAAFAVAEPRGERLMVHDAAAADAEAGRGLLAGLGRRWPGLKVRLVDEPATSPLAEAARASGLATDLTQVEMINELASADNRRGS